MAEKDEVGVKAILESFRARGGRARGSSSEPEVWLGMSRLPSSSAESYRSVSPEPCPEPCPEDVQQKWWKSITKSVVR